MSREKSKQVRVVWRIGGIRLWVAVRTYKMCGVQPKIHHTCIYCQTGVYTFKQADLGDPRVVLSQVGTSLMCAESTQGSGSDDTLHPTQQALPTWGMRGLKFADAAIAKEALTDHEFAIR